MVKGSEERLQYIFLGTGAEEDVRRPAARRLKADVKSSRRVVSWRKSVCALPSWWVSTASSRADAVFEESCRNLCKVCTSIGVASADKKNAMCAKSKTSALGCCSYSTKEHCDAEKVRRNFLVVYSKARGSQSFGSRAETLKAGEVVSRVSSTM